jgi:transcriptional regulator with XRE-family HTH domain
VVGRRPVFHKEIGAWLANLRNGRGLSLRQVEIASKGKISKATLTSLELGRIKNPDEDMLRELARIYGAEYSAIALRFVEANYGRDLVPSSHVEDPTDDPVATRMELERLKALVAQYETEAREMRTATDAIVKVALRLAALQATAAGQPRRRRHHRKLG